MSEDSEELKKRKDSGNPRDVNSVNANEDYFDRHRTIVSIFTIISGIF